MYRLSLVSLCVCMCGCVNVCTVVNQMSSGHWRASGQRVSSGRHVQAQGNVVEGTTLVGRHLRSVAEDQDVVEGVGSHFTTGRTIAVKQVLEVERLISDADHFLASVAEKVQRIPLQVPLQHLQEGSVHAATATSAATAAYQ